LIEVMKMNMTRGQWRVDWAKAHRGRLVQQVLGKHIGREGTVVGFCYDGGIVFGKIANAELGQWLSLPSPSSLTVWYKACDMYFAEPEELARVGDTDIYVPPFSCDLCDSGCFDDYPRKCIGEAGHEGQHRTVGDSIHAPYIQWDRVDVPAPGGLRAKDLEVISLALAKSTSLTKHSIRGLGEIAGVESGRRDRGPMKLAYVKQRPEEVSIPANGHFTAEQLKILNDAYRFFCGMYVGDHPKQEQQEYLRHMRAVGEVLNPEARRISIRKEKFWP
jgi:hypothetical protein